MKSVVRTALVTAGLLFCLLPAVTGAAAPTATADDWPALIKEKDAEFAKLKEIKDKLATAQGQQAVELRTEGTKLIDGIFSDLFPRMRASALEVLKRDAVDEETINAIIELAYRTYQENKFAEAGAVADAILVKAPENAVALNLAGVCHFAVDDFEKSAQLLATAQEKNVLMPDLGAQYAEIAPLYVEYWKEEHAIREKEAAAPAAEQNPQVELDTSRGKIVVELFEDAAPNTVANFVSLVESGFYNGTKFHRVLPSFMAQGGDPNTKPGATGNPGSGGPGYSIKCEWDQPNSRRHFAGTLSMAHAGRDSGGSQFFLTHLPTPHLDKDVAVPAGRDAHTVFGRVIEGMDVVLALRVGDELTTAKVLRKRNHEYKPETTPDPQQ